MENGDPVHFLKDLMYSAIHSATYVAIPSLFALASYKVAKQHPAYAKPLSMVSRSLTAVMGAVATTATFISIAPGLYSHSKSLIDNQLAQNNCDKRKESMAVFPASPWLARHLYMNVEFDDQNSGALVVKRLQQTTPNASATSTAEMTPYLAKTESCDANADAHWQHLESIMKQKGISRLSLSVSSSDSGRYLQLETETDLNVTKSLIPIHDTQQWDLERLGHFCNDYETGQSLVSVFHPGVINAITNTLSSDSITTPLETLEQLSNSFATVSVKSKDKQGAVVDLDEGGRLLLSDQSNPLSLSSGFILLTDRSMTQEELLAKTGSSVTTQMTSSQFVVPSYVLTVASTFIKTVINGYAIRQLYNLYWSKVLKYGSDHSKSPAQLTSNPTTTTQQTPTTSLTTTEVTVESSLQNPETSLTTTEVTTESSLEAIQGWVRSRIFSPEVLQKNSLARKIDEIHRYFTLPFYSSFMFRNIVVPPKAKTGASAQTVRAPRCQQVELRDPLKVWKTQAISQLREALYELSSDGFDLVALYNKSRLANDEITAKKLFEWQATLLQSHESTGSSVFRKLSMTPEESKSLIYAIISHERIARDTNALGELPMQNRYVGSELRKKYDAINRDAPIKTNGLEIPITKTQFEIPESVALLDSEVLWIIIETNDFLQKPTINPRHLSDLALSLVLAKAAGSQHDAENLPLHDLRKQERPYNIEDFFQAAEEIGTKYGLEQGKSKAAALFLLIKTKDVASLLESYQYQKEDFIRNSIKSKLINAWVLYEQEVEDMQDSYQEILSEIAARLFEENIYLPKMMEALRSKNTPPMQASPYAYTSSQQPHFLPMQPRMVPLATPAAQYRLPADPAHFFQRKTARVTLHFKQSISTVTDYLFSKDIISAETRSQVMEVSATNQEKASKIVAAIRTNIQINKQFFNKFLHAISECPELQGLYQELTKPEDGAITQNPTQAQYTHPQGLFNPPQQQTYYQPPQPSHAPTYHSAAPVQKIPLSSHDTMESVSLKKITRKLHVAFKSFNHHHYQLLMDNGFLNSDNYSRLTTVLMLSDADKAHIVYEGVSNIVNQNPTKYHDLITLLNTFGIMFKPAVKNLREQYKKTLSEYYDPNAPVPQATPLPFINLDYTTVISMVLDHEPGREFTLFDLLTETLDCLAFGEMLLNDPQQFKTKDILANNHYLLPDTVDNILRDWFAHKGIEVNWANLIKSVGHASLSGPAKTMTELVFGTTDIR